MCEHCGCRGVEPIADLMDEHFELLDLGGEIRRHLAEGNLASARSRLAELGRLLDRHVRREERGVFAALKAQGDFVDAVVDLEAEHAGFDAELADLDPDTAGFGRQVQRLLDELAEHIEKENLGVFPAAVVSLGATGWDIVSRAHGENIADDDLSGDSDGQRVADRAHA